MKEEMIKAEPIQNQAYRLLRQKIIKGEFKAGDRLRETSIAEEFGISRSPVREAIRQLVSDGILYYTPNCGVCVRSYSSKEIADTYAMRRLFECYAIEHIDNALRGKMLSELKQMRDYIAEVPGSIPFQLDLKLHGMIISLSDNTVLKSLYDTLFYRTASFPEISSHICDENAKKEHLDLLDSIIYGDDARAISIINKHLSMAETHVQNHYISRE